MAATRVMMMSTTNIGFKSASSFLKPQSLTFCFNNKSAKFVTKKRGFACSALYKPDDVQIKEEGLPETLDYRVFFHDNTGKKISPWHDIPLHVGDGAFNFIVEIPKESSAKMEVATDEIWTPIKQDTKKGKLRYYP
nr:soluble inorganic pyrophosphatase 6, chloroplastic-like [Tanacetum cinerariifolium]